MQRGVLIGVVIAVAVVMVLGLAAAFADRGGTVTGTVIADGEPVPEALVTASYRRWAFRDGQLLWDDPVIFETNTDAAGRFRLAFDGRNRVRLRVFASGFQTIESNVVDGEVVDLVLEPSAPFVQPGPRDRQTGEDWASYFCQVLQPTVTFVRVEYPDGLVEIADETFATGEDIRHPVRSDLQSEVQGWVYRPEVFVEGYERGPCSDFVVLSGRPDLLSIPELRLELPLD